MNALNKTLERIRQSGGFIQFMTFVLVLALAFYFAGRFSAPATVIEKTSPVRTMTTTEQYKDGRTNPTTRTTVTDYFRPEREEKE